MSEILEVLQLAQQNGMSEMKIGRGRIESSFNAKWLAGGARFLQLFAQFRFLDDLC